MPEYLVPIAISSQLDVTGEERIHAAKYTPSERSAISSQEMFIAVASNGEIASSLDGITWTLVTDTNDDLRRIEYYNNRWIATSGTDSSTYMSQSGTAWAQGVLSSPSTNGTHPLPVAWTNDAGYLIGKDTTNFYRSDDGVSWTSDTISVGTTALGAAAVNLTNGDILFGDNNRTVWKSTDDGATWNSFTTAFAAGSDISDMIYVIEAGLYVATAINNGVTSVVTSPDGETWSSRRGNSSILRGVAYGDGTYVVVGDGPLISYSTSILTSTWSTATHPFTNSINDVAFGWIGETPTFVAVSSSNEIAYSINGGVSWVAAVSPFTVGAVIRSVAFGITNNV